MKKLAIVDTAYQLMSVYLYMNESSHTPHDFNIILPNEENLIQQYKRLFKNKSNLLIRGIDITAGRIILMRSDQLILNELGIKNKILALIMNYKTLIVIDDGLASAFRTNRTMFLLNLITSCSFIFMKRRKIRIYSNINEPEKFSRIFKDKKFSQNLFKDNFFYICSAPILDGLNRDKENNLINILLKIAQATGKNLIILPHRRDPIKFRADYLYSAHVLNPQIPFEEFYYKNRFINCAFVTLYSTAILCVSSQHQRFFIKNYFKPKIRHTIFRHITIGIYDDTHIHNIFVKLGIKKMSLKIKDNSDGYV